MNIPIKDRPQMFCDSPDCPCEDICCQVCDNVDHCKNRCHGIEYSEKIYNDVPSLIQELNELANNEDRWIYGAVAQIVEELDKELEQHKKALELACESIADTTGDNYCPADYITHNGALCAEKQPCNGKEKECWKEYYLQQAKAGEA